MVSDTGVLFIEPALGASRQPVVDKYTKKMTAAWRRATVARQYLGVHLCRCGVASAPYDYRLPNGELTNSLCIHYLAYHRSEVPNKQLQKVGQLKCGEEEPSAAELKPPRQRG